LPASTDTLSDYKALVDALPGQLLLLAPNAPFYTVLAVSEEWLRATGQERAQVVQKGVGEVYPQHAAASNATGPSALSVSLQQALARKQVDNMPVGCYQVAAADGMPEARYWSAQSKPVLDTAGEVRYLIHSVQDSTEQRQREQALRESEARYAADRTGVRRLYELQAKLAEQTDVKAAFRDVLALACEFTGTDRGCVQFLSDDGRRLEMFAWQGYSEDSPFINFFRYEGLETGCEVARVQRKRLIIEDTVGFEGLDGTEAGAAAYADGIRAAQSTPMTSRASETIGVISTQFRQPHRPDEHELRLLDMLAWTAAEFLERHRAEVARRESEALVQKAFSIDTVGILYFSLDGGMSQANEALVRMSGYRREELLTLNWEVLTAPEFWNITRLAAGELADRGETAPYEKQFVRPDGSRWWGLCSPTRLTGHGQAAQCMEFIIDISERKQAEEQLQAFAASLEELVAARTRALHESQELLQSVLGGRRPPVSAVAGQVKPLQLTPGMPGMNSHISEVQRLETENLHLRLSRQQALFEAVQQAQELERKRVAEGLHNGIGQLLFATKLRLNWLDSPVLAADPALVAARQEADRMLTEAISQTRALSHELVPRVLEEFGLAPALRDICQRLSSSHLRLCCHVVQDEAVPPLSPLLQLALYRMAQELGQNIVKHARGATTASLELEITPGYVLLWAEDNGAGFATDAAAGTGLRTIRDRVTLLNGTLEQGNRVAFGTYVRLRIPLPAWSPAGELGTERQATATRLIVQDEPGL
jgi:PAS domain S-box-containing protein